ncbi:hypothetical protein E6H19_07120 [Candidatus Bathyarchaeota archaeon]|nr:MAG: hypothetical protein E6H19_07120 [Candidatus Bathyarchaeota archaeon]
MVVLPLTQVQFYNGPPCLLSSGCPTIPESVASVLLIAAAVDLFTGIAVIFAASMLRIGNPRQLSRYGWLLVSLAVFHMSSLISSMVISTLYKGVGGPAIYDFLGPLIVLWSGWVVVKKKPKARH